MNFLAEFYNVKEREPEIFCFSERVFHFPVFLYLCAVKRRVTYRTGLAHLLAALMIFAVSSRVWLTHERGYYESYLGTAHPSEEAGAWVSCNCPICHAEDYLATEAEYFEYNPIITTIEFEYGIISTAEANRIVVTSSLRGPPCLS